MKPRSSPSSVHVRIGALFAALRMWVDRAVLAWLVSDSLGTLGMLASLGLRDTQAFHEELAHFERLRAIQARLA